MHIGFAHRLAVRFGILNLGRLGYQAHRTIRIPVLDTSLLYVSYTCRYVGLLPRLDRDRHDDRRGAVVTFDKLDRRQRLGAFDGNGQVANLSTPQIKRELRMGHIDAADVVGEMVAVQQLVVLDLTVGVTQPHDHGDGSFGRISAVGIAPTGDAREQMNRLGRETAGKRNRARHRRWNLAFGAIEDYRIGPLAVFRIDKREGDAIKRLGRPV